MRLLGVIPNGIFARFWEDDLILGVGKLIDVITFIPISNLVLFFGS